MSDTFKPDRAYAKRLDEDDPLSSYRGRFSIPHEPNEKDLIYFSGNSLGIAPRDAREVMVQELEEWDQVSTRSPFPAKKRWVPYHELFTEPMAGIVGAQPNEVVVMNGLTVNLHLMMASFYRPTPTRHKILIESGTFPSDRYAMVSQIQFRGFDPAASLVEVKPREGESTLRTEDIEAFIDKEGDSIALVLFGGVNYYSGQAFDMERITRVGQKKGCTVGFDLAHAAGNVPVKLHDWNVDFAAWCTYKYLNGGPGAPGAVFVHERHGNDSDRPRLAGWWGHEKTRRHLMEPDFSPNAGAEGWMLSTSSVFGMAPLQASLKIFEDAGMETIRAKSERLTGYLEFLLSNILRDRLEIVTPKEKEGRGAQLSIRVKREGKRVFETLRASFISCDWREPDVIRLAPAPLYNQYLEVYRFTEILSQALEE